MDFTEAEFYLHEASNVIIILDLRHIDKFSGFFTYGKDWDIAITLKPAPEEYDPNSKEDLIAIDPAEMPSIFLEEGVSKMDRVELSILAYKNLIMRVDVLVYTGLFSNYLAMFLNTSSVKIVEPDRANLGTNKIYAIMLDGESTANIPVNIPVYSADKQYPEFSISYAHTQN